MALLFSADALTVSGLGARVFEVPLRGEGSAAGWQILARNRGPAAVTAARLVLRGRAEDTWAAKVAPAAGNLALGVGETGWAWDQHLPERLGLEVDVADGATTALDVRLLAPAER